MFVDLELTLSVMPFRERASHLAETGRNRLKATSLASKLGFRSNAEFESSRIEKKADQNGNSLYYQSQFSSTSLNNIELVTENDYSWCTLSGGFMTHWTTHFFDKDEHCFHRPIWRFFQYFKMVMIIRIVHIISQYRQTNYRDLPEHVYLGTFGKFMGGPLHFTELIAFFWSLSESMMYLFCINPPRHKFGWILIFLFLNQANIPKITAESVHLDLKSITKLKRAAKMAFTMSSQYISQIITGFPVIITLLFYFNFTTHDFVMYGIPWALVWTLWTYCGCMVVYWLPSYFFVYCYYLKLRIRTVNDEMRQVLAGTGLSSVHLPFSVKPKNNYNYVLMRSDIYIRALLIKHDEICREIRRSNYYWTRYLSMIFFMYTLIICILLFFLLMATMPWYSYIQYSVVILSGHVILLVIVIYSAKIVWSESRATFRLLSVAIRLPLSIGTKIKIMTYLERLKINRQGFFLITGQLLSAITFQEVCDNIFKYFLLVVQNQN